MKRASFTLALLCGAQFVLQLDFSIVNVALPAIDSRRADVLGESTPEPRSLGGGRGPSDGGLLLAVVVPVVYAKATHACLDHVLRHLATHVGAADGRGAEVDAAPYARVLDLPDR
jgi:hypothetical protein